MGIIKTIYTKFYNGVEVINLKQHEKLKLIELLLIIGSILTAFKEQPDTVAKVFMMYLVVSILYYILLQNAIMDLNSGDNYFTNLIPLLIAVTFSLILSFNIFASYYENVVNQFSRYIVVFLYMVYYGMFIFLIYAALANISSNQSRKL